jgi:hypothetical protein
MEVDNEFPTKLSALVAEKPLSWRGMLGGMNVVETTVQVVIQKKGSSGP